MGMRRNTDTEDFANSYKAMKGVFDDLTGVVGEFKANSAAEKAQQEHTQTESDFGPQDPSAQYTGPGAPEASANPNPEDPTDTAPSMTNAEAASYGISKPTATIRKYAMGLNPTAWQDKAFTPDEKRNAGTQARADFWRSHGNTDKADKLESGLYTKKQRAREDVKFDRDEEAFQLEKAYKQKRSALAVRSPQFAAQVKYASQLADFQVAQAAYEKASSNPDLSPIDKKALTPPVEPEMPAVDPLVETAHEMQLAALDYENGKLSTSDYLNMRHKMTTLKQEGYAESLRLAQAGAPVEEFLKKFASQGGTRIRPDAFIDEQWVKRDDGMKTRVMRFRASDGSVFTIDSLSGLESIGKATHLYERMHAKARIDATTENTTALRGLKAEAAGERRTAAVDKAWQTVQKDPAHVLFNMPNEDDPGGKSVPSRSLHALHADLLNRARQAGQQPAEASQNAEKILLEAVNKAKALKLKDPKSPLTVTQLLDQEVDSYFKKKAVVRKPVAAPANTAPAATKAPAAEKKPIAGAAQLDSDGIPLPPKERALHKPYGFSSPDKYKPKTVMTPFSPNE
jgi:hypothetical protein